MLFAAARFPAVMALRSCLEGPDTADGECGHKKVLAFQRDVGVLSEQQRKELATHLLTSRNDGNAFEQRLIRIGHDAIPKSVDHCRAPWPRRVVCS